MRGKYKRKKQRQDTLPRPDIATVSASANQETPAKKAAKPPREHDKKPSMRLFKPFAIANENFKLVLETVAVFSAIGVLFVYISQLGVMRQTVRMDERAWISVSYGDPVLKENEPIFAPTTITNTGKTPAKHMEGFVYISPVKRDAVPDFGPTYTPGIGYMRTTIRAGMLAPNAPFAVPFIAVKREQYGASPIFLTPELRQDIQNEKTIVIIYGQITYEDVFGVKHWLHFCGAHGSMATEAGGKCSAYNDTDND